MKKRTFLFLTAVLCLTVFSCAKTEAPEDTSIAGSSSEAAVEPSDSEEIPEDVPEGYIRVSLMAGTESSKTTISDGSGDARIVSWAVGDEIKIH